MKGWSVCLLILAAVAGLTACQMAAPSGPLTDRQIVTDLDTRLMDDDITGATTFDIGIRNGVVTLRGVVKREDVRARALSIARGTPGVVDVIDQIERQ